MLDTLEVYARDLERQIKSKRAEYKREQNRADKINFMLLPPFIADKLKYSSNSEMTEFHPNVSLYFSDIVGFTSLGLKSTPMQVMNMIGNLFSLFDDTISRFNVQKIETIGDAYFAVSGCPQSFSRHASEIGQS